jgi:hypothetical protein
MAGGDVERYLEGIASARRRADAGTVLELLRRVTGEEPAMWGPTMVGFGRYHYRYESGREGDAPAAAFSARRQATVLYLSDGVGAHEDLLARLGPHSTGVGCLYVKDVGAVDLDVLEQIVRGSYATLTAGTFTNRARDSGGSQPPASLHNQSSSWKERSLGGWACANWE